MSELRGFKELQRAREIETQIQISEAQQGRSYDPDPIARAQQIRSGGGSSQPIIIKDTGDRKATVDSLTIFNPLQDPFSTTQDKLQSLIHTGGEIQSSPSGSPPPDLDFWSLSPLGLLGKAFKKAQEDKPQMSPNPFYEKPTTPSDDKTNFFGDVWDNLKRGLFFPFASPPFTPPDQDTKKIIYELITDRPYVDTSKVNLSSLFPGGVPGIPGIPGGSSQAFDPVMDPFIQKTKAVGNVALIAGALILAVMVLPKVLK